MEHLDIGKGTKALARRTYKGPKVGNQTLHGVNDSTLPVQHTQLIKRARFKRMCAPELEPQSASA